MREGVAQYLGKARKCSCGRVHETPLKRVVIEPDALQKVPGILEELGSVGVSLVSGQRAWREVDKVLDREFVKAKIACEDFFFLEMNQVPEWKFLG